MSDPIKPNPYEIIADLIESKIDHLPAFVDESRGCSSDGPKTAERAAEGDSDGPQEPRAMGFDVDAVNSSHALVLMGSRAVVVREQPAGPIEDRVRVLSLEGFQAWYRNRPTEVIGSDGKIKTTTWGTAWLNHKQRRQYSGIEFYPNPDGAEGASGYLNLWRGYGVVPAEGGSYAIFRDHLLNNVCGGDPKLFDYVWAWFAHIFQRPRERIGTALVLRGRMGSGKTKVGEVIGSLIPAHYFMVDDPRYIVGQFNAHMASCLLLQGEEAVWAGDKHAEGRLKGLITSESQMIESKGIDPIRIRNFVRVLMTSNEDWVVPAGKDERRFCVLDVHPRCAQDHGYFREMDEELNAGGREALLRDLLDYDLSVINLRQIPHTRALLEQKVRSFDSVEGWWYNRLTDGKLNLKAKDLANVRREWDMFIKSLQTGGKVNIAALGDGMARWERDTISRLKRVSNEAMRTRAMLNQRLREGVRFGAAALGVGSGAFVVQRGVRAGVHASATAVREDARDYLAGLTPQEVCSKKAKLLEADKRGTLFVPPDKRVRQR